MNVQSFSKCPRYENSVPRREFSLPCLFALLVILCFGLNSCAFFGVPGEYSSWFTHDIEIEPVQRFELHSSGDWEGVQAVTLASNGLIVPELVFHEYEWGNRYKLRTRGHVTVRKPGVADIPMKSEYLLVEKVIEKTPVAKGSCFTTFLTPLSAPLSRASFAELFSPNPITFGPETDLAKMKKGITYTLKLCFNKVPDMTINIEAIFETPSR